MTGSYPPGCIQRDHDRAFSEMGGPDPDDELRAEAAYLDSWWEALEEFAEEHLTCETTYEPPR